MKNWLLNKTTITVVALLCALAFGIGIGSFTNLRYYFRSPIISVAADRHGVKLVSVMENNEKRMEASAPELSEPELFNLSLRNDNPFEIEAQLTFFPATNESSKGEGASYEYLNPEQIKPEELKGKVVKVKEDKTDTTEIALLKDGDVVRITTKKDGKKEKEAFSLSSYKYRKTDDVLPMVDKVLRTEKFDRTEKTYETKDGTLCVTENNGKIVSATRETKGGTTIAIHSAKRVTIPAGETRTIEVNLGGRHKVRILFLRNAPKPD